jgi:hypothetical protein
MFNLKRASYSKTKSAIGKPGKPSSNMILHFFAALIPSNLSILGECRKVVSDLNACLFVADYSIF